MRKKIKFRHIFYIILILIIGYFIKLPTKYETPSPSIYKELDVSTKGNVYDFNISIRDSEFYEFTLAIASKDVNEEKRMIELVSQKKQELKEQGVDYNLDDIYCQIVPQFKIAGSHYSSKEECKGANILLKLKIHSINKHFKYKYLTGDDLRMRWYEGNDDFEIVADMSKIEISSMSPSPNGSWAERKRIAAVGLYKGDYQIRLEVLNDTPLAKEAGIYLKINRYRIGKFGELKFELD